MATAAKTGAKEPAPKKRKPTPVQYLRKLRRLFASTHWTKGARRKTALGGRGTKELYCLLGGAGYISATESPHISFGHHNCTPQACKLYRWGPCRYARTDPVAQETVHLLYESLPPRYKGFSVESSIIAFNDARTRNVHQVLTLIDRAIDMAKEKG